MAVKMGLDYNAGKLGKYMDITFKFRLTVMKVSGRLPWTFA